jgi:hypothetical protein
VTGLSICVGGWLVLNAIIFAALMLRRGRPVLRDRLFRWAVDGRRDRIANPTGSPWKKPKGFFLGHEAPDQQVRRTQS